MEQQKHCTEEWLLKRAHTSYFDPKWPVRYCDKCDKPYTGPAVYCSFECALADA